LDGIPIDVEALDNLGAFVNLTSGASLVGADDPATPMTVSQTTPAAGTDANSGWLRNGDNESCTEEPEHPRTMFFRRARYGSVRATGDGGSRVAEELGSRRVHDTEKRYITVCRAVIEVSKYQ
jgi:hypothetical protein